MDSFSESVLQAVSQHFVPNQPFHLSTAYTQLRQCGAVDCDTAEFAACLDRLVVERHLTCFLSGLNDLVYSLNLQKRTRQGAKATLDSVFATIKRLSTEKPVTVNEVASAVPTNPQRVRCTIEILFAMGIVHEVPQTKQTTFQWDSAQELSLLLCAAATSACLRLRAEIAAIHEQVRKVGEELYAD
jgi:hypothetical protein